MALSDLRRPPAAPSRAPREPRGAFHLRRSVAIARGLRAIARLLLVPFALAAAAIAGIVFAVLLPVCGVATLAEGIARASWSIVRDTLSRFGAQTAPRD